MSEISPQRRKELLDALRRGTVPADSLDALAVGIDHFRPTVEEELDATADGRGVFKAVRGDYGSGKTFFIRYLQANARDRGFATAEMQVSAETPIHKLETVYRRVIENLATEDTRGGALKSIIDSWFYALEEEVLGENGEIEKPEPSPTDDDGEDGEGEASDGASDEGDSEDDRLLAATNALMEKRLESVTREAPAFAACLRGYRQALLEGDSTAADGLVAWLSGLPNVSASITKRAGIKGKIDHFGALSFLKGLLTVLRDSGRPGLVLVLDEVETLQRARGDVRRKGLLAIRQLMDEVELGRFPGLYIWITGTPEFFEGQAGVPQEPALQQRLYVDFATDPRFDNPRAVQIRLSGFDIERLCEVATRVRDIFLAGAANPERVRELADDAYLRELAHAVTGSLGGKVGITPRLFLKKLVADVLDRIDQHAEFDPRQHYSLTVSSGEMSEVERTAAATSADDIPRDMPDDAD